MPVSVGQNLPAWSPERHKRFEAAQQPIWGRIYDQIQYDPFGGCWLWTGGLSSNARPLISWRGRKMLAYRVTYELTFGAIPKGRLACHRCDTPQCVNPHHIFLGSHADNNRDARDKGRAFGPRHMAAIRLTGRQNAGASNGSAKLDAHGALLILALKGRATQRAVAVAFGVHQSTVQGIWSGRTWRSISRDGAGLNSAALEREARAMLGEEAA